MLFRSPARCLCPLLGAGLAALLVAGCGGEPDSGVQANIVRLDHEAANVLSAEMAQCVRQTASIEISDDFLVVGEHIPLDMDALPPEVGQALVACLAQVDSVPDDEGTAG